MVDALPEPESPDGEPEFDWKAWQKRLEAKGLLVPARNPDAVIDWDALRFLPFTEDEVSAMFMELRNEGKL